MSEVKSFWCHEASNVLCVRASDFDNVTRLFLDAAERAVASERREKELQQRLTAADERADVLTSALEGMLEYFPEGHSDGECFSVEMAKAALKPAEVERNQCDGCQAGIPVVNGAHRMGKPDGYPDTMSCTAKMYVEERPNGCCCPPKGHTGLWAAAMCPVHQGLRALKR
jgi:hypothetical protein